MLKPDATTYDGWWFYPEDGILPYGDGRPVEVGTMSVDGPIIACRNGLHASAHPLDALRNYLHKGTPGLARVTLSGNIDIVLDKAAGRTRTIHWLLPPDIMWPILREFACQCAERALHRERDAGREPDPRSWAAIIAARAFIIGNIDRQALAEAHAAAAAAAAEADARAVDAEADARADRDSYARALSDACAASAAAYAAAHAASAAATYAVRAAYESAYAAHANYNHSIREHDAQNVIMLDLINKHRQNVILLDLIKKHRPDGESM